jgi:nucleotide-binding universal stress UspA family protein
MAVAGERVALDAGFHGGPPEYKRVIVALDDCPESLAALPTACALAAPDGGSLVGVFVIEVPTDLPLEAHMFEAERSARSTLDRARATAEQYGLRFTGRIVRSHGAGEAIVAEAERLDADLIVLAGVRHPGRRARAPLFEEAVRAVLLEAPCRVLVLAPPEGNGSHDGH